jgi:hypothetical protein
MIGYMKWQDVGILTALGVAVRADIEASDYPELAYEMGKGLSQR